MDERQFDVAIESAKKWASESKNLRYWMAGIIVSVALSAVGTVIGVLAVVRGEI